MLVPADWRDWPAYQEHYRHAKAKIDAHAAVHGCSPEFVQLANDFIADKYKDRATSARAPEYRVWTGARVIE
jgi:hypothetical protein